MATPAAPTEIAAAHLVEKLVPLSPAERMRRSYERRRRGLRALTIEVRETEVEMFIRCGRLASHERTVPTALRRALYSIIDDFVCSHTPLPLTRKPPTGAPWALRCEQQPNRCALLGKKRRRLFAHPATPVFPMGCARASFYLSARNIPPEAKYSLGDRGRPTTAEGGGLSPRDAWAEPRPACGLRTDF